MMRSLVMGASGQVGGLLMQRLASRGEVFGTGFRNGPYPSVDLADAAAVRACFAETRPDAVFVPAGVTAVDWCEANVEAARRICADGSRVVQEEANRIGAFVIHFSTDFIFSGDHGPYDEAATPDPISRYGEVKLAAEWATQAVGGAFAIARTSMVYSDDLAGKNFLTFVRKSLAAGSPIKAFTDQAGSPTYAPWLADAAIALFDRRLTGVWNLAGPECMTRYDWACRIARHFSLPEGLIEAVTSASFVLPARRPGLGGGLLVGRVTETLGAKPTSLADALAMIPR